MDIASVLFSTHIKYQVVLGYALIFLGTMFEGDMVVFMVAFLTHRGFFNPVYATLALFFGSVSGDLAWYYLGRKFHTSTFFLVRWMKKIAQPFDKHIHERVGYTIFIAKFLYGVHRAVLFHMGAVEISRKKVMVNEIWATSLWVLVVGIIGYFSSFSLGQAHHYLRFTQLALFFAVVLFIILKSAVTSWLENRL